MWEEKPARYTRALLETMSLIAYRQPITRGEIEEVRGVSVSSNIIKTLMERDWIKVLGHKDVPGKPTLYGTTKEFLDYFNLKTLDQLPTLAEIKDLESIHPELELDDDVEPSVDSDKSTDNENDVDNISDTSADEAVSESLAGETEAEIEVVDAMSSNKNISDDKDIDEEAAEVVSSIEDEIDEPEGTEKQVSNV